MSAACRATLPQPALPAAQTRSIAVPGRTSRASSAVHRPGTKSTSAAADAPPHSATNAGRATTEPKSRPSGLPCRSSRGPAAATGSARPPPSGGLADRSTASSSLPSGKMRAQSANPSTSGLVAPGSGSKVVRAPSRSLSRDVQAGRRGAAPPPPPPPPHTAADQPGHVAFLQIGGRD